jgi:hypothetical protein
MNRMKTLFVSLGMLFGLLPMATAEVPHKKFIEAGWDMPGTVPAQSNGRTMPRGSTPPGNPASAPGSPARAVPKAYASTSKAMV